MLVYASYRNIQLFMEICFPLVHSELEVVCEEVGALVAELIY